MSVTIWAPAEPTEVEHYDCQCVDLNGNPDPDCFYCHGKGRVSFETHPHGLNLTGSNFQRLFEALGIDPDPDKGGYPCGRLASSEYGAVIAKLEAQLGRLGHFQQLFLGHGVASDYWDIRTRGLLMLFQEAQEQGWPEVIWG